MHREVLRVGERSAPATRVLEDAAPEGDFAANGTQAARVGRIEQRRASRAPGVDSTGASSSGYLVAWWAREAGRIPIGDVQFVDPQVATWASFGCHVERR